MRVTIDDKYYCKQVNLPTNLYDKLLNALPEPCAWALVFAMFFVLARMAWRCF